MKNIKFKAKNLKGEWVYGYYWSAANDHFIKIIRDDHNNNDDDLSKMIKTYQGMISKYNGIYIEDIKIDPDTLCQYTGMTDKFGCELYENDTVFYEDSEEFGAIIWNKSKFEIEFGDWCVDLCEVFSKDLELVRKFEIKY